MGLFGFLLQNSDESQVVYIPNPNVICECARTSVCAYLHVCACAGMGLTACAWSIDLWLLIAKTQGVIVSKAEIICRCLGSMCTR